MVSPGVRAERNMPHPILAYLQVENGQPRGLCPRTPGICRFSPIAWQESLRAQRDSAPPRSIRDQDGEAVPESTEPRKDRRGT
jgi:hypothetical protein